MTLRIRQAGLALLFASQALSGPALASDAIELPLGSFLAPEEQEDLVRSIHRDFGIEVVDAYLTKSGYTCKRDTSEAARTSDCWMFRLAYGVEEGRDGGPVFVPIRTQRRISYQLVGAELKFWVVTSDYPSGG